MGTLAHNTSTCWLASLFAYVYSENIGISKLGFAYYVWRQCYFEFIIYNCNNTFLFYTARDLYNGD